jgi:hypothetical protein
MRSVCGLLQMSNGAWVLIATLLLLGAYLAFYFGAILEALVGVLQVCMHVLARAAASLSLCASV